MPEHIAGDSRIIIGLVVSVGDFVLFCVLENLRLGDSDKGSRVVFGLSLDAHEPCYSSSFRDSVEEGLGLIVTVMRCCDDIGMVFYSHFLEPFFSYISRAFLDGCLCFFSFLFDIDREYFERDAMFFTIFFYYLLIAHSCLTELVIDMAHYETDFTLSKQV